MAQFDTKEMANYLKCAMELEASVYSQERAIAQSQKYLDLHKPRLAKAKA